MSSQFNSALERVRNLLIPSSDRIKRERNFEGDLIVLPVIPEDEERADTTSSVSTCESETWYSCYTSFPSPAKTSLRSYCVTESLNEMSEVDESTEYGNKVFPLLDQSLLPLPGKQFSITWRDVKYVVKSTRGQRFVGQCMGRKNTWRTKTILKGVSGQLKSGQMMGIMGTSGAGKSTLLECIVGKRQIGRTGDIVCNSYKQLMLSFVPQTDQLFEVLTVREALTFASTLLNSTLAFRETNSSSLTPERTQKKAMLRNSNKDIVSKLLAQLGLDICADNRINRCSGGQLKRLSIAQELVGKPDILVLDEPTSGLDSSACQLIVELLQKLTGDKVHPTTVLLTIHQPSYRVLCMFHTIYVLSSNGKCIYNGGPTHIVNELAKLGLMCPEDMNPADFLMDIANGDHGSEVTEEMASNEQNDFMSSIHLLQLVRPLDDLIVPGKFPDRAHFWPLVWRAFVTTLRDPWLFGLRFGAHLFTGIAMGSLLSKGIGQKGGCPPNFDADFDPTELEAIQRSNKIQTDAVLDNAGNIFFGLIVILFTAIMPTVICFPLEMAAFVKEKRNQWYSIRTYYIAKTVADIPFQILFPTVFVVITYWMGDQVKETWRFSTYLLIAILVSFASQSHGLLVGAIFMKNIAAGVYLAPMTMLPMALFAGYFLKVTSIPSYFMIIAYISYVRYGFEAALGAIFGYNRCGANTEENILEAHKSLSDWMASALGSGVNGTTGVPESFTTNLVKLIVGEFVGDDGRVRSSILNHYDITDTEVVPGIVKIVIMCFVIRFVVYLIVSKKANAKG